MKSVINLARAENQVVRKELLAIYKTSIRRELRVDSLTYPDGLGGSRSLRSALAGFFNRWLCPIEPIKDEHIAVTPGATNCLATILSCTCSPGDTVLIPGSYWNGFDVHFPLTPRVVIVNPAPKDSPANDMGPEIVASLEETIRQLSSTKKPRAIVVTNPHNPTGRVYDRTVLEDLAILCQRHSMLLIVDEVYALSRCAPTRTKGTSFRSAVSLDLNALGVDAKRVVTVWGTSKDFGSSGIRIGCAITRDPRLQKNLGFRATPQICALSSLVTTGLLNHSSLPHLIQRNQEFLGKAYRIVDKWCTSHEVDFVPAAYGLFVLARLAPLAQTAEDECAMCEALSEVGVLVAPGQHFHWRSFGWARICFAVEPDTLREALRRIASALKLARTPVSQRARGKNGHKKPNV
ncbi:unnamed protein product [Zymoseptoria tritici ST99CH_1A5]|uniref:Aminocyclopropane-1-carboxylate synthase-like protein n=3 Tax=Zymoseptoria tritici TaxID=1047171 RepID=F9X216_ZYMTI|nr:aminocyclopropane-1-carboxylate synthase-like protein [Zymoseptoria tritici IPO323]EGP89694.1 aminocyclopropane-1-carboxylate synthase-like protein [Zymoseptoria tritici IPO323]SMR45648.1 unnamed protein product [Zymoseptoria tritici ST99CH_1E4]SMR46911.1 unnamed protein product [Zymoseptoria tritici ST99CH_3D1]SMY20805.1 unnamed protein product [Zymoseptoria tritici ST99CH_1A5]